MDPNLVRGFDYLTKALQMVAFANDIFVGTDNEARSSIFDAEDSLQEARRILTKQIKK